ncbi:MAG: hypothetical protein J5898_01820 [Lachnospiraceae bacterium]|nr:hypothetical protein [Lachnospiraceae bacterium]MBP5223665.1 hypothetical protein [Lachnospiraceae bacterium]
MFVRGVMVEPGEPPKEAEIDTQNLSWIIGEKRLLLRPFKDRNVGAVCDENYASDGTGLKYNRSIGGLFHSTAIYGNMFIAGLEVDGSLLPLNDQQIKLYLKLLSK